jgi:DNA repair protein RadC
MIAGPADIAEDRIVAALRALDRHFAPIAEAAQEIAIMAYLDPEWRLLGMRHHAAGQTQSLLLPVRSIVADAIALDAVAVALAHNHPSGDPTPSSADYRLTQRLARTLDAVDVRLVEHVVLARDGIVRFRTLGLL